MSGSEINPVKFTKWDGSRPSSGGAGLPGTYTMSKGSKIPSDVARDIQKYNEEADKYGKEMDDVRGGKGIDELSSQKRKKWRKLYRESRELQTKAEKKIAAEWIEDLKRQGVDVPANISNSPPGVAMEKLAGLQCMTNLSDSADEQLGIGDTIGMSVTQALILANINRTKVLDQSLKSQLTAMRASNKSMAEANHALSAMNAARPKNHDDEAPVPAEALAFAKKYGVPIPENLKHGNSVSQEQFDKFAQSIKNWSNTKHTNSQMQMVTLQATEQKRNNAFELVSNLIKKLGSVSEQIISSMR